MPEKEKSQQGGSGKFILVDNLRKKFSGITGPDGQNDIPITNTSLLLEGIHFNLVYFPLAHLGYKAVISSISGIYSKGGVPSIISVNLGISTRFKVEDIETIFQGVDYACRNYSLKLSDISVESSLTGLTLAVTASGSRVGESKHISMPSSNDLVCVTGKLGASYMGLHILERERKVFEESGGAQPRLEGYEYVIGQQLKPDLPVAVLEKIRNSGVDLTSLTVSKEGLSSDLVGLSKKYSLGCRIYLEKIPISAEAAMVADELGIEPVISALNGGDDYQFLFTVPITGNDAISAIEGVAVIGHITPEGDGCNLVLHDGSLTEILAPGWEK